MSGEEEKKAARKREEEMCRRVNEWGREFIISCCEDGWTILVQTFTGPAEEEEG